MLITKANAQKIVQEMERVINRHINMMDPNGYIIAATSPERIGKFHKGANKVITERLNELIVNYDGEYEGCMKGINFPVQFNGETIGVIGITGEKNDVSQFARIIQKMTEILIVETYRKEQDMLVDRTRNYFIEEWIFGSTSENDASFELRGKLLNVDIQKPRICAVIHIANLTEMDSEYELQKMREEIIRDMKREIEYNKDNLIFSIGAKCIFLFGSKSTGFVKEKMEEIKKMIQQRYPAHLAVGVGSLRSHYKEVNQSYAEAVKALRVSLSHGDGEVMLYENLNIELFVEALPHKLKKEFTKKIFKNCTEKEIDEWVGILSVFFKYNGSVNRAADELYIHKNTMQYRINKLVKKTGLDPRVTKDAALLYLAILIHKIEKQ
jgi:carbohydrate diacid regulator